MGLLDGLLNQVSQSPDVANLAAKVGLTPEQAEQAIAALAHAHPQPGDTVGQAADATGLPTATLEQVVMHLGGEGALGRLSGLFHEQGGLSALGGLASGLFGRS